MRLLEIRPPKPASTESTLATLLQFLLSKADMPNLGDKSASEVRVPTNTVLAMMNKAGTGFSYNDLDAAVKRSETVKNLIKSMNQDFVTIKAEPSDMSQDVEPGDETDVARMATRASKKRI